MIYLPGAKDVQPGDTEVYGVHDFLSRFIKPNAEQVPGQLFDYNSSNADVLGWLVSRISGMPLHRYIQRNIWSKLGTEHDALIAADRALMAVATGGMNSSLRDAARFGQMILNRGQFNGEQIVPAQWVDATLSISDQDRENMRKNPKYGTAPWQAYKNMWWVLDAEKGEYAAVGVYGQVIYINRSSDMVIAWHSSQEIASAAGSSEFRRKLDTTRAIAKLFEK